PPGACVARPGRTGRPPRTPAPEQRTSPSMSSPSPASAPAEPPVPADPAGAQPPPPAPPLHALFQRRIDGDDALLRLARLRFEQAGLAAEVYADDPGQLEWVLGFAPPSPHRPVIHLDRRVNLL